MKIGIIGDIHFSEYSSILRGRGGKYSHRLENCITSINWAEYTTSKCDQVVYLGDFFDKPSLNAEEITALNEIAWNDNPHRFLVGNHEMGINSLIFSSAHIFEINEATSVIEKPYLSETYAGPPDELEICYLPYTLEENREPLDKLFPPKHGKRIIFSHNDIAGIQMGQFISKTGYSIEEIEENCDLFFNGHLHNGMPVTDKIINVGNLTGQNFSEDGFRYSHNIMILDTVTMDYEVIRNPYAINFYKIDNLSDLYQVENAVVTVKVGQDQVEEAKKLLENDNIIASRMLVNYYASNDKEQLSVDDLAVDHREEFKKFIYDKLEGEVDLDLLAEEVGCIYE